MLWEVAQMQTRGPHPGLLNGSLSFHTVLGDSARVIVRSPGRRLQQDRPDVSTPAWPSIFFPLSVLILGNWPLF